MSKLLPVSALLVLPLLAACASTSGSSVILESQARCPQTLEPSQQLILRLPSNPTTGYRWEVREAAAGQLRALGPEVYSAPQGEALVGAGGHSTWRFEAQEPGESMLSLTYQRPWEAEPIEHFECLIRVR